MDTAFLTLLLLTAQMVCSAPLTPFTAFYRSMPYAAFYSAPFSYYPAMPSYPPFYPLTPPLVSNAVTLRSETPSAAMPDQFDDELEVSQFHAQDATGRSVFGFNTPDQVRLEARNSDGTVKGSYSYLDALGNTVKMQYWDDGTGFHATGTSLPRAVIAVPQYTPEVQAARDLHFRLYQQALQAAIASGQRAEVDIPNEEENIASPDGIGHEEEKDTQNQFSAYQVPPRAPLRPVNGGDSVSLDNPELDDSSIWSRQGKSPQQVADPAREQDNGQLKHIDSAPMGGTSIQEDIEQIIGSGKKDDGDKGLETIASNGGFFYSFHHPVPQATIAPRVVEEAPSVSLRGAHNGATPLAAVHDAQVSPKQLDSLPNHNTLPLYYSDMLPAAIDA